MVFCLFFIVIGGVSASDVVDVSDNPNNDDSVSDSINRVSEESVGNYIDQISNESISSTNSLTTDEDDIVDLESSKISSKIVSSNSLSASKTNTTSNTTNKSSKVSTNIKISSKNLYSGQNLVVSLKDKNNKVISGKKIIFNITSIKKTYTRTTNSKGQANLTLNCVGTLKVVVSFAGDSSYSASKISDSVKVSKANTKITIANSTVPLASPLVITLKNSKSGNIISGKKVKITIGSKTYTKTTNSNGQAKLTINIKKNFNVTIKYAGNSKFYSSKYSGTIKPVKSTINYDLSSSSVKYAHNLTITLKNKLTNKTLSNKKISLKITNKNKTYTRTSNSKGKISIPINYIGNLSVKLSFAGDDVYKSFSKTVKIKGVKDNTVITNSYNTIPQGSKYEVVLKDSNGKVLTNKKLSFTINGKVYNKTTDSKGKASLTINLKNGTYSIKVNYAGNSYYSASKLSKNVKVNDSLVAMSDVIKAATTLRAYVDYTNKLNSSYVATINGKKYSVDELAYLMAQTLVNIKKGSSAHVEFKNLTKSYSSKGDTINGNLYKNKYLILASDVVSFVKANNRIPNYKTTTLGKTEANLYIFGMAKALQYYGANKKVLPNYLILKSSYIKGKSSSSLSQNAKILNYKELFNATEFAKYLKTGGKSALNSAIIAKAKSLTSGLTSTKAKANAIFKYVRDYVSYSYYANSQKGAAKTLSTKSANCCDKANLIVAMCRSVGIYARYSHAQGCTFSSGLVTGHVWAQIYDTSSQTWLSADATSYRNSLGTINNWNTKSYSSGKNYVLIPF